MNIYRTALAYHVIYPDFAEDTPEDVERNTNRHLSRTVQGTVTVEYVDDEDPSQGYSITVGDNDPVLIADGGFAVDPVSGQVIPSPDEVPNSAVFVTLGMDAPSSDSH